MKRAYVQLKNGQKELKISHQVRAFVSGEHFTEALIDTTQKLRDFWRERQSPSQDVRLLHAKGSSVSGAIANLKERLKEALQHNDGISKLKILRDYSAFSLNVLGDEYSAIKC